MKNCSEKDTVKEWKTNHRLEENMCKTHFWKGLEFKINKELSNSTIRKKYNWKVSRSG